MSKPDDALVAVADGELGDLGGLGGVPHGRQQGRHPDRVAGSRGPGLAVAQAGVDRLDDALERQAPREVLLGGVAALGVDDAVGGEVLRALAGDAEEALAGLHDGQGVVERLEVARQGAGVGALAEPGAERSGLGRGQGVVADVRGQLDDGLRAQPAVEVVVQQDLGRAAQVVDAHALAHASVSGGRPRPGAPCRG